MKIKSKVRGGLTNLNPEIIVAPPRCNPSTRTLGPVLRPVLVP
jgi:hypothetical protein